MRPLHILRRIVRRPSSAMEYKDIVVANLKARGKKPPSRWEEARAGDAAIIDQCTDLGAFDVWCVIPAHGRVDAFKDAGIKSRTVTLDRDVVDVGTPLLDEALATALAGGHLPAAIAVLDPKDWANVLRVLADHGVHLPVVGDRTGFEWVGSDLPVLPDADQTRCYLHQFFAEHFAVKDPILVRVEAWAGARRVAVRHRVMRPDETWIFTAKELDVQGQADAAMKVRCWHPVLTRGRHHRMRLAVDVTKGRAVTTLHSGHDFGPYRVNWGEMHADLGPGTDTVVTIPDYERLHTDHSGAEVRFGRASGPMARATTTPGHAQRAFRVSALLEADGEVPDLRYRFTGQGDPFWFRLREGPGRERLAANHFVTTYWNEPHQETLDDGALQRLQRLEQGGLRFLPFAVPLPPPDAGVHFGFSFRHTRPEPQRFRLLWYDAQGGLLAETSGGPATGEYTYPSDLDPRLARQASGGILVVSPDWAGVRVHPMKMALNVDLGVFSTDQGADADWDSTELQGSWKNIRGYVRDVPRWMFPPSVNTRRTNVVMRGVSDGDLDTRILVMAASGDLGFRGASDAEIRFYRPDSAWLRAKRAIPAWTHRIWSLGELFPDLRSFCPEGRGYLRVTCTDMDLNVYGITDRRGGLGLQHFWGY